MNNKNNFPSIVLGYAIIKYTKDKDPEFYDLDSGHPWWSSKCNTKALSKSLELATKVVLESDEFANPRKFTNEIYAPSMLQLGKFSIVITPVVAGGSEVPESTIFNYDITADQVPLKLNDHYSIDVGTLRIIRNGEVIIDTSKGL